MKKTIDLKTLKNTTKLKDLKLNITNYYVEFADAGEILEYITEITTLTESNVMEILGVESIDELEEEDCNTLLQLLISQYNKERDNEILYNDTREYQDNLVLGKIVLIKED